MKSLGLLDILKSPKRTSSKY